MAKALTYFNGTAVVPTTTTTPRHPHDWSTTTTESPTATTQRPTTLGGQAGGRVVGLARQHLHRPSLALTIIAGVTFTLLFLLTGSVLLPAKALVLNLLSLLATFGAMVWTFQEGHPSILLGWRTAAQVSP